MLHTPFFHKSLQLNKYHPTFHNYFSIRILNGTKSNTFLQERTQCRPRNIFEYSFLDFKSFDQQENRVQMKIIQSIHNNISTPENWPDFFFCENGNTGLIDW